MNTSENPHIRLDIDMDSDPPSVPCVCAPELPNTAYVTYATDDPGAQYGEPGRYDGYAVASVPATSRDIVEWQAAHKKFRASILEARVRLQAQQDAMKAAQEKYVAEVMQAVRDYKPVQDEISLRQGMVEACDDLREEQEQADREERHKATMEAEDAVLGPRSFTLLLHEGGRKTLHHVECSRYRSEDEDWYVWTEPMRADKARQALGEKLVKACRSCRVEDRVHEAESGRCISES